MTITPEWAHYWSGGHTAETAGIGPLPTPRLKKKDVEALDAVTTDMANWILGNHGQPPLVPAPSSQLVHNCQKILDRNHQISYQLDGRGLTSEFTDCERADLAWLSGFGVPKSARSDAQRPFVRVMFCWEVDWYGYYYVKQICDLMMHEGWANVHFNAQLWLGEQAWHEPTVTAWVRAKTLLAARDCQAVIYETDLACPSQ